MRVSLKAIEELCWFYQRTKRIEKERHLIERTLSDPNFSAWEWGIARLKELNSQKIQEDTEKVVVSRKIESSHIKNKVAVITAIYGNYEKTCKKFTSQITPCDFICFTDNSNIKTNGWIIDSQPYHMTHPSPVDTGHYNNSLKNNKHTFNIGKYYKMSFLNIPRLSQYEVIIWIDGSLEITNPNFTQYYTDVLNKELIIGWEHEQRFGMLMNEIIAVSKLKGYTKGFWREQPQPMQRIYGQYAAYLSDGYKDSFWKNKLNGSSHEGVWCCCCIGFKIDPKVKEFLDFWYLQVLKYTNRDQISFPYALQKKNIIPYTLPDEKIKGEAHRVTDFYIKHEHGK
jgi:hypothetical protein